MSVSQKPYAAAAELARAAREAGSSGPRESAWRTRLTAHLRAGSLDRALADGADPRGSRQLAARAQLLTSPASRARAADALERLVRRAQGPHRRWWALSQHNTVLANSSELHALASLLHSERAVYAQGIAALNLLLSDGTGPVYRDERDQLAPHLRRVHAAIAGHADDEFRAFVSSHQYNR